ncbi:hypothetical protein [Phenylobacterium sp.]|uniref:hypothetical protein n=1 Tax=Phenylobacterium sp. TaxID=1871053 RepID=UPI0028111075|nr:hypothetical protein [Phenylobacterium sp.]
MTDQGQAKKSSRRIPPLVWIVLALLVGWLVVAMIQRGGTDRTPGGGSHPTAEQGPSVMPPAPASGTTPATPGNVANGPAAPTPE